MYIYIYVIEVALNQKDENNYIRSAAHQQQRLQELKHAELDNSKSWKKQKKM